MMNIYISGPITGIDPDRCELNFSLAKTAIEAKGHYGVSPWHIAKHLPESFEHRDYMDVDMVILEKMDALLLLDGWEESRGCTKEFGFACRTDLPVFYSIKELPTNK